MRFCGWDLICRRRTNPKVNVSLLNAYGMKRSSFTFALDRRMSIRTRTLLGLRRSCIFTVSIYACGTPSLRQLP